MPIPFKEYVEINDPSGSPPPAAAESNQLTLSDGTNIVSGVTLAVFSGAIVAGEDGEATVTIPAGAAWEITDGTHTVSNVSVLTVSGAVVGGSAGAATLAISSSGSTLTISDGTHTENDVTFFGVVGGTISSGASGQATLTIPTSEVEITDGTHSVTGLEVLTVSGGVISGSAGEATLTVASALTVTDGTHTETNTDLIGFVGATVSSGESGQSTVTINGWSITDGTTTVADVIDLSTNGTITTGASGHATLTLNTAGGAVRLADPINGTSLVGQTQLNRPAASAFTQLYFPTGTTLTESNTGSLHTGPLTLAATEVAGLAATAIAHGYTAEENFTLYMQFNRLSFYEQTPSSGLFLYESSTGLGFGFEPRATYGANQAAFYGIEYSNTGAQTGISFAIANPGLDAIVPLWLIVRYDASNSTFYFYASSDGSLVNGSIITTKTASAMGFSTFPDEFGFHMTGTSINPAGFNVYQLLTSSP